MKVSVRILSLQLVMGCFVVVLMMTFHYLANKLESDFDALEYKTLPVLHALEALHTVGLEVFASTHRILLLKHWHEDHEKTENPGESQDDKMVAFGYAHEIEERESQIKVFEQLFQHYEGLVKRYFPHEMATRHALRSSSSRMMQAGKKLLATRFSADTMPHIKQLELELEVAKHAFEYTFQDAVSQEMVEIQEHHENLETTIKEVEIQAFFSGSLLLLLGALLGKIISRSIVRPLQQLANSAQNMEKDQSDLQAITRRKDEIGHLATALWDIFRQQSDTQKALHNQLNFQTTLMEAIPSPIFFKDTNGRYNGCNKAFETFMGKPEEEIVNKTVYDLAPKKWADRYHEADQSLFDHPGTQIYESSVVLDHREAREVVFHKATYRDQEGKVAGLVGAILDITQLKKTEEQLAEEMAFIEGVIERLPGLFYLFDPELGLQRWNLNMARETGYSAAEMVGKEPLSFIAPEDHPLVLKSINEVFTQGSSAVHAHLLCRNGRKIPHFFTGSTISRQGKTYLIGMGINTNELKQMEEALRFEKEKAEEANRAKSRFLAHMSHEIRTPMNAIIGMADLLMENDWKPQDRIYLDVIQRNSHHLLTLINDILDLSKVEAGQLELETVDFDVQALVQTLTTGYQLQAQKRGTLFSSHIDPDLFPHRRGDLNRLRQILENLISNALKFTPKGLIELTLDNWPPVTDGLQFSLSDTGIGIPPEKLTSIFDAFTQADSSTTRQYGGTGLGLTICRWLIEWMGGEIMVESTVGKGSLFRFWLPLPHVSSFIEKKTPILDLTAKPTQTTTTPTPKPLTILLAEDVEDNILVVQAYLGKTPHRLDLAENGQIAVEKATAFHYDLILMDVQMPILDGYEAVRRIRHWESHNGHQPTPIWTLTAHAMVEEETRGREAGCTGHLTKPLRKAQLLALLRNYGQQKEHDGQDNHEEEKKENTAEKRRTEVAADASTSTDVPPLSNQEKGMETVAEEAIHQPTWDKLVDEIGSNTAHLVMKFLQRLDQRIEQIEKAVHTQDGEFLANETHKLKGACSTLGAQKMTLLSQQLEMLGRSQNFDSSDALLVALKAEGQRVHSALESLLVEAKEETE